MEFLLTIPWYLYSVAGALLGVATGRIFKDNFEAYFGRSFVVSAVIILAGTAWIFFASVATSITSRELGNIYFTLLGDYVAFYVTNLIASWLFSK